MKTPGRDPVTRAFAMLQAGQLAQAVPILKRHLAAHPDDFEVLHNLGMALSDLGELDDARRYLLQALESDPRHTDTLVALGVAFERGKDSLVALPYLERAVKLDPTNAYAQRNLGGVLVSLARHEEAEPHLRDAYDRMPSDQLAIYSLALGLCKRGGEERLREADGLFTRVIGLEPESPLAELARQGRSTIAQLSRRSTPGEVRPEVILYCVGAMEAFEQMSPERVRAIGHEIALLGRSGLDVNNPATRYRLRNLDGDFSGLHLLSLMYVAYKQIAPNADIHFDLSKEYEAALSLHRRR